MKTSDFLKDKMRELRITQNEVGRRCDISQGTVHNILNGGSIREDTVPLDLSKSAHCCANLSRPTMECLP